MATARQVRLPSTSRYEFREPIGEGGAGTVFRAFDRQTQADVAIKVLSANLTDNPTLHRRLLVEFQAAQALEHPNIVRALDCQTDDETSYLVYELVEGGSLGDRIEQAGKLSEDGSDPDHFAVDAGPALRPRAADHPPGRQARQRVADGRRAGSS